MNDSQSLQPAATVIPVRDTASGFEVLLLERHSDLPYLGGAWVFPGGRVEDADAVGGNRAFSVDVARRTAVREAREESGLDFSPDQLVLFSHWLTPPGLARRFDTRFFVAGVPQDVPVHVDGLEIVNHRWMRPMAALAAQSPGGMVLPPPVFVTLIHLSRYLDGASLFETIGAGPSPRYLPRLITVPGGVCSVYQDDAAYHHGDLDGRGRRHRLWMLDSGWLYEGHPSAATV
jgi:8-oxo-dGTP pyrophosphatase MutT (NUDIX family)